MIKKTTFFVLLACLTLSSGLQAQWICHVVNENGGAEAGPGTPFYGSYVYTALSCKGNNAIAAADVDANVAPFGFYLAFLVSNDGGITWRIENEGLPGASLVHEPIIRRIDQIDSLNIVAFGDSNLLIRSTDGGTTWMELASPTADSITDVSFSDSLHGMIVVAGTSIGTYITSDGGNNWVPSSFSRPYGFQCHDYGDGKYRIISYYYGVVYTTNDYGVTVDSTSPIISDTGQALNYPFVYCSFGQGDTIFDYGQHRSANGYMFPAIAKTTNGGAEWSLVFNDTMLRYGRALGYAYQLSDVSRDTILAALENDINSTLISTDRGDSWNFDTLMLHDSTVPQIGTTFGIGLNSECELLGAVSLFDGLSPGLIVGIQSPSGVQEKENFNAVLEVFPNPTSNVLNVQNFIGTVSVLDPIGRVYSVPRNGNQLDVSSLSAGIYFIQSGSSIAKFVKE